MPLHIVLTCAHFAIVALAMLHALMTDRRPEKTMSWMLVLLFLPVAGLLLYIYFGIDTRRKRHIERMPAGRPAQPAEPKAETETPDAQPITNGLDWLRMLIADIGAARHTINIDIYIFAHDALGQLVADCLIDKARQGVSVRVVYDDVGSWATPQRFFRRMEKAGALVAPFLPVRLPIFTSKANYRNHRKLIAIDAQVAYIGGMNIARRYARRDWRDTMLRVRGATAREIDRTIMQDWRFATRETPADEDPTPPARALHTHAPSDAYPGIMQTYMRIIARARRYIYLQTPYFLPTESIAVALRTAALSGIDVRLMVPRHSDTHVIEWASRSFLREMARAGVRIGLYEPGFLHSKTLVADDHIASCGSTNIDVRSFESNFEANLFLRHKPTVAAMRDIFLHDWSHCTDFASLHYLVVPTFRARIAESAARLLTPLL